MSGAGSVPIKTAACSLVALLELATVAPRPAAAGATNNIDDGHGSDARAAGAVGPELCKGESARNIE